MFSSIRARLWLSYAALIVAALLIAGIVLTVFLVRNPVIYRQTTSRIKAAESLLVREPRAAGRLELITKTFDVRVMLFASDGSLQSDSDPSAASLNSSAVRRVVRNASVLRDSNGDAWLYSRTRLPDGAWLVVAAPRPRLLPLLTVVKDELWRPFVQGGLISLLLALVLAYLLARWIADPLQLLVGAAHYVSANALTDPSIARDDSETGSNEQGVMHVPEHGPKEVRQLIHAFNAMLTRVWLTQKSQKDFVANVSHELKTPLTSIQGFAQALMDGAADTQEDRHQAAQIIHTEAGRMHRMAVELLDLARLDAGTTDLRMGMVDAGRLLQELDERIKPIALSSGIQVQLSLPNADLEIAGDEDQLAQAISNIVDNALKNTPRGGVVTISSEVDADEIRVLFTDTGRGIATADIPHIFDRFYQADSARDGGERHGAGLGLAIARDIVMAHGGRISVRSALGQGAVFTVHLPRVDRPE